GRARIRLERVEVLEARTLDRVELRREQQAAGEQAGLEAVERADRAAEDEADRGAEDGAGCLPEVTHTSHPALATRPSSTGPSGHDRSARRHRCSFDTRG